MCDACRNAAHDDPPQTHPDGCRHLPGGPAERPNTWQHRAKVRVCRLCHELESVCREADETNCECGARASELRAGARCLLQRAETLIESAGSRGRSRRRRWRSWWHGELYEGALGCMHEAEVLIVSLYTPCRARRQANSVLAMARPLCREDPRLKAVDTLMAAKPPDDRELPAALSELLGAGYAVEEERAVRSRNFRNRLIRAGLVLLVLLGAVVGVAFGVHSSVPVCGLDPNNCLGSDAPSGQDTGLVMLLGMLGAALPMAGRLQRMGGSWNPYSLPFWQEMVKLPIGALTAVTGLVLVGTDWLPLLKVAENWRQVASYAVVFGVVQLALTHAIDKRAEKLLAADPDSDEAKQLENVPSKRPAD